VILDGHNDLALRAAAGSEPRHIDLARAAEAGFSGGFFALTAPTPDVEFPQSAPYAMPLADPVSREDAIESVESMLAALEQLDVEIVTRVDRIRDGQVNAIVHFEGAEPLAPDLSDLEDWYERGVRSVGIVWSRPNAFGEGVPFAFPGSPDTGPGLTRAGLDLVYACGFLGIMVDVSHLNERGFWDVARASQQPLVATHSNAHALSPSTRNLTDRQLDAIGESGGVVGVNFGVPFLSADWHGGTDVPLSAIVAQIDYIAKRIGVDHVAFGSDFEGVVVPDALGGIEGLPGLVEAIREAGYDDDAVARITHGNWLRLLDDVWKPWGRYYRRAGFDARSTLLEAAVRFASAGVAVDIGAGTGRDTLELLRRGWRVVAIDQEQEALDTIVERAGEDGSRLETRVGRFEEVEWPACDLLNASYAMPFTPRGAFRATWRRISDSLRPGGRFAGQFFGPNDDWANAGLLIHTRVEVEGLFDGFEIEHLEEEDADGTTTVGKTKHWHLFHVVARKL
jgi:membrane dipeptidase